MAKKKTKKKKTACRTGRQTSRKKSRARRPQPAGLLAKLCRIRDQYPEPPTTGAGVNWEGLPYQFTRWYEVKKYYEPAIKDENLCIQVVDVESYKDDRCYRVKVIAEVIDLDTQERLRVAAVGLGNNAVWSCNSAQTVALKQIYLNLFQARWPALFEDEMSDPVKAFERDRIFGVRKADPQEIAQLVCNEILRFFGDDGFVTRVAGAVSEKLALTWETSKDIKKREAKR